MRLSAIGMPALVVLVVVIVCAPGRSRADDVEEAYSINQDAMVDMSTAEFQSAADKFLKAGRMVPDYGIKDRSFRYTPTFMAAWAFEKMVNIPEACRYFRRFLKITTHADRESTKEVHAQSYIEDHCAPFPSENENRF